MIGVYGKLFDLKGTAMFSVRAFTLAVILIAVTASGYAKTAGGGVIATTTLMTIDKNNCETAERGRLLASAPTEQCSLCHREIIPFSHLPVFPDKTLMGHNDTEPNPEWKEKDVASIQWHNTSSGIEFVKIKMYRRDKGKIRKLYALEVPYQPTRFFLPAEEGVENPHRVLDE